MSSGRSDQPQPPDWCPAGEAINSNAPDGCPAGEGPTSNSNRRTWTEDEGPLSNSVVSARAACEGPTSNSAAAAFPLGRHYGQPVQQGSRTQVSTVGNLGESQTVHPLLPDSIPEWKAFGELTPKEFTKVHKNRVRYLQQRPRVRTRPTRRRSSRFARALRVSDSAVLRHLTCPLRSRPRSGCFSGGSVMPCSSSSASSTSSTRSWVRSHSRPFPSLECASFSSRHSTISGHASPNISSSSSA